MSSKDIPMLRIIKAPIATLVIVFVWLTLTSASYFWNERIITQATEKSFSAKGEGSKRLVEILLNWTERHDEIYVPVAENNPQNPYLTTDHKFIKRTDGKLFTQISVARILDQFNEAFDDPSYSLSLISQRPLNPKNIAKGWQSDVLANHQTLPNDFTKIINNQFYYIAPLIANDNCFQCHLTTQLETDNTLGGIIFSYDISQIREHEKPLHRQNLIIHGAIFFIMCSMTMLSLNSIRRLVRQLEYEKTNRDRIIEEKTSVLREEIMQHKEARNALQKFSTHDPLTGIRNRRHLLEALHQELKRYQRYKNDFSLLLLDLDHFRQINDKFGNECGDTVLKALADFIDKTLRENDTFARYDGEEFAIIAINTPIDSALRFADKLVKDISQQHVNFNNHQLSLSVSIGVATPSLLTVVNNEQLLTMADRALHLAKSKGRNCAIGAHELSD